MALQQLPVHISVDRKEGGDWEGSPTRPESSRIVPPATHSFLLDPVSQTSQRWRAQTHESMRDIHQTVSILTKNTTLDGDKKIRKKHRDFPKSRVKAVLQAAHLTAHSDGTLLILPIVCGSLCFCVMSLTQAPTPAHPYSS